MISFLINFFITSSFALTLESGCRKISVAKDEIKYEVIDQSQCVEKKLSERLGVDKKKTNVFFIKGLKDGEYFSSHQELKDSFFCQFRADQITSIDINGNKNTDRWNSLDKFSEVVSNTNQMKLIKLDPNESRKDLKVCYPIPDFFRFRRIQKDSAPVNMRALKAGGYMAFSTYLPGIFFMNRSLDKIEYAMNVSKEERVLDALFLKNGNLKVVTRIDNVSSVCTKDLDPISFTILKETCVKENDNSQILLYLDQKLSRAYSRAGEIVFEELSESSLGENVRTVKINEPFNLQTAIVSGD